MSRRYRRYFIMLEGEDQGFELSKSKEPKGYGKIEVRNEQGTLSLHCQNLKKVDPMGARYRWYLVNTRKTGEPIIVDIGPMEVGENGKGELVWEFNGENVKGSNSKIDQFNILALVVEEKGDKTEFSAPLVGYIDKEKSQWKDHLEKYLSVPAKKSFVPAKESKPTAPKKEQAPLNEELKPKKEPKLVTTPQEKKPDQAKVPSEKPAEEKRPTKESKQPEKQQETKPVEGPTEPKVQEHSAKTKVDENIKEESPKPKLKEEKPQKENKVAEPTKPYSPYSFEEECTQPKKRVIKSQASGLQAYIESTLKGFPKVDPFVKEIENYQWWQIQYDQQTMYRSAMPFIGYIEGQHHPYYYYYPSEYQRLIYAYQHYLFGVHYDEEKRAKYFVYGIPGSKLSKDQPYRGNTGFNYWHPCNGDKANPHASGYWLLHIDAATGEVVTPLT